jgi:hypothetical protein
MKFLCWLGFHNWNKGHMEYSMLEDENLEGYNESIWVPDKGAQCQMCGKIYEGIKTNVN